MLLKALMNVNLDPLGAGVWVRAMLLTKMETILLVPSKLIVHRKFMMFDFGALFFFVYLLQ